MVHMTFQRFSSTIESLPKIKAHLSMVKRTKIVLRTCNLPIYGPPPIGHRNFSRPILSFALFDLIVEFIWTLNVQLSRHWQKYSAVRFPTNKKCPNGWRLMMSLVKCIFDRCMCLKSVRSENRRWSSQQRSPPCRVVVVVTRRYYLGHHFTASAYLKSHQLQLVTSAAVAQCKASKISL